jgi:hypothetical protein
MKPKVNLVMAIKTMLLQNQLSMVLKGNRIQARMTASKMEIHPVLVLKIRRRVDRGRIYQIFNQLISHHKVSMAI